MSVGAPSNFENLDNSHRAYSKATIDAAQPGQEAVATTLTEQNTLIQAVTSYSLTAVSNAQAYAFGAESNATATTDTNDVAVVLIRTGAKITGTNSVDIEARHDNASLHANAQSGCHAAFGTANSYTYQDILNGDGANSKNPYSQAWPSMAPPSTTRIAWYRRSPPSSLFSMKASSDASSPTNGMSGMGRP